MSQAEKDAMYKELYELEIADRDSARKREVEVKKAGGQDWMMFITGYSRVGFFCIHYLCSGLCPFSFTENELFVHLMGMIEGVVVSNLFAYYYGTSTDKK